MVAAVISLSDGQGVIGASVCQSPRALSHWLRHRVRKRTSTPALFPSVSEHMQPECCCTAVIVVSHGLSASARLNDLLKLIYLEINLRCVMKCDVYFHQYRTTRSQKSLLACTRAAYITELELFFHPWTL